MNWSWTELLAFLGCLGLAWKISQQVVKALRAQTQAIKDSAIAQEKSATAQAEARRKTEADKERTETLWALSDIHKEMIESIIDHLSLPPEIRANTPFHRRRMGHNLEKKARKRLENYDSGFTEDET